MDIEGEQVPEGKLREEVMERIEDKEQDELEGGDEQDQDAISLPQTNDDNEEEDDDDEEEDDGDEDDGEGDDEGEDDDDDEADELETESESGENQSKLVGNGQQEQDDEEDKFFISKHSNSLDPTEHLSRSMKNEIVRMLGENEASNYEVFLSREERKIVRKRDGEEFHSIVEVVLDVIQGMDAMAMDRDAFYLHRRYAKRLNAHINAKRVWKKWVTSSKVYVSCSSL